MEEIRIEIEIEEIEIEIGKIEIEKIEIEKNSTAKRESVRLFYDNVHTGSKVQSLLIAHQPRVHYVQRDRHMYTSYTSSRQSPS